MGHPADEPCRSMHLGIVRPTREAPAAAIPRRRTVIREMSRVNTERRDAGMDSIFRRRDTCSRQEDAADIESRPGGAVGFRFLVLAVLIGLLPSGCGINNIPTYEGA